MLFQHAYRLMSYRFTYYAMSLLFMFSFWLFILKWDVKLKSMSMDYWTICFLLTYTLTHSLTYLLSHNTWTVEASRAGIQIEQLSSHVSINYQPMHVTPTPTSDINACRQCFCEFGLKSNLAIGFRIAFTCQDNMIPSQVAESVG